MGFNLMPMLVQSRDEIGAELELNEKYKKISEEKQRIFVEIAKHLPEQMEQLIYQYEEIEAESGTFESEALYLKGLQHGIELAVMLKVDKAMFDKLKSWGAGMFSKSV